MVIEVKSHMADGISWIQEIRGDSKIKRLISKIYKQVSELTEMNMEFTEKDENVLTKWAEKDLFKHKFADLSKGDSEKLKKILFGGYKKGYSTYQILTFMRRNIPAIVGKIDYDSLDRIIRTEEGALENKAREKAYLQAEKIQKKRFKYKWINPGDERTTEADFALMDATKDGVYLSNMKKMVEQYSKKYFPLLKYTRDFILHPNCRGTYIKVL